MKSYVSVNNQAKEIKNAYISYNNKAIVLPLFDSGGGLPEIATWHDGTDEQIVAMVAAADAGLMNLSDYWAVGDERDVSLSAMSATGVGESHVAQTVEMMLCDADNQNYVYVTPTSGRTYCNFVIQQKDCLSSTNSGSTSDSERGYMNSSNTNSGSWNGCARRAWCNNVYYNALPSAFKNIIKQVKVITAQTFNGSTNQISNDYIFLPAGKEIYGSEYSSGTSYGGGYSNYYEAQALTQWEYYKTASNRIKKMGSSGSACYWWGRSPYYNSSSGFCVVGSGGSANGNGASNTRGIAPGGCV